MLDRLRVLVGKRVIVDYYTSGTAISYAKGVMGIEGDLIVVENGEKMWFIDPKMVAVMRIDEVDE